VLDVDNGETHVYRSLSRSLLPDAEPAVGDSAGLSAATLDPWTRPRAPHPVEETVI